MTEKDICTIIIEPHTILKLIKCNVLVAEIVNENYEENYISVLKENLSGYNLYTYETNTDELKISITFDKYMLLEIKE